jgi:hypothetical protein
MVRTRLTSSGLSTGGSLSGSFRQIVATERDAEQEPHSGHDPIAIADARTALDEVQLECRTSSGVAVSGERFSQAANRLQLWM